jgi:hypothetical protein
MPKHSHKKPTGNRSRNAPSTTSSSNEPQEEPGTGAPEQTSTNDIKQYIEAATDATERSRRVLIILITASVLTLIATWNSRKASWFDERYNLVNAASHLFTKEKPTRRIFLDDYCIFAPHNKGNPDLDKRIDLYQRADKYLTEQNITDGELVIKTVEGLKRQQLEHVAMVRMPFFGVGFDINDIGIFAGFTFAVVLLWFRFSLLREVNNLRLTFFEARRRDEGKGKTGGGHDQLKFCYAMLAMRQVLTTPKMWPQDKPAFFTGTRTVFWIVISRGLLLLPLAAQFLVIRNDINSDDLGRIVSPDNTDLVFWASRISLVIIIVLLFLCYQLVYKASKTWKEAADELNLK